MKPKQTLPRSSELEPNLWLQFSITQDTSFGEEELISLLAYSNSVLLSGFWDMPMVKNIHLSDT